MGGVELPDVERTGVLIVRAWLEDASGTGLRVRITQTLDVSRPVEIVTLAATSDEVYKAVRSWLETFTGG